MAGENDCFSDDFRIGIEAAAPESGAEYDRLLAFLVGGKTATGHHGELNDVEEVGGDGLTPNALRLSTACDGSWDEFIVGSNAGEGLCLTAHVGIKRVWEVVAASFAIVRGAQFEQCGGIADGRGAQHKAAHHGEDGCVGSDAQADGKNCDRGDSAVFPEGTETMFEIAEDGFEPGERAPFAMRLADLLRAAKTDESLAARFGCIEAGTDACVGVEGQMAFELCGKFCFLPPRVEESAQTKRKCSELSHRYSLGFFSRRKKSRQDVGGLLPLGRGVFQLAMAGLGELVEFCLAIVFRRAPARSDEALLFELQQRRVERAVVQLQQVSAGLLNAPRQPVTVLRTHGFKRAQHHQRQSSLPYVGLVAHCVFLSNVPLPKGSIANQ